MNMIIYFLNDVEVEIMKFQRNLIAWSPFKFFYDLKAAVFIFVGNYAYLMESSTMEYIINGNCNLTQVGGLLDTRGYGIATTSKRKI